ncbi:4'-phosphopantetheinyl transferase [Cyathus striatus]|nr:4'-phosphopantetheinyl transferase [Cyathus striatus]
MSILGIGVDLVHVPRIMALITRRTPHRFATRILNDQEFSQMKSLDEPTLHDYARFLSVRWAVKEAAYKAMFPTVYPTWKELSYRGIEGFNKPSVAYHPFDRRDGLKIGPIHLSVSHDGEYVVATVIAEVPH